MKKHLVAIVPILLLFAACGLAQQTDLEKGFANPPQDAKPRTWWHWVQGCVTKEGITADMEAMQRVGIGGAWMFTVNQLPIDDPSIQILNPKWRDLLHFAETEADRLHLEFGAHNDPGWSSSGGPWVKVEQSMQYLTFTETSVKGGTHIDQKLDLPKLDPQWNYYGDVACFALPRQDKKSPIAREAIIDISKNLSADGTLNWNAPPGDWTILRIGHTTTGKTNKTAPLSGLGLEVDKMDRDAVAAFWEGYPAKILADAGPLVGNTFKKMLIDSYEAGPQNWTPKFREEFISRRGYDPLPWLPMLTGRVINSADQSKRFKYDFDKTISELFIDNYYKKMAELTHAHAGLDYAIEPYSGPFDALTTGGTSDEPMGEFWQHDNNFGFKTVRPIASSAHTWGKNIVGAEAFTGWPTLAWRQDLYSLKANGDLAFCSGINQLILHTTAHQPWMNVAPGMTMGWWGTNFGRTQTWWNHGAKEWIEYLSRCQFLLQQGNYVADICFLDTNLNLPKIPDGYSADTCAEEVLLTRMSVKDGRLFLPNGMSYAVLALPDNRPMTPQVARKIRDLVHDGATVIGPRSTTSPSLQDFPKCDAEVAAIGKEVWGDGPDNKFGNGRAIISNSLANTLQTLGIQRDVNSPTFSDSPGQLAWNHRRTNDADIYFISNQKDAPLQTMLSFRASGKTPWLWHADTGRIDLPSQWKAADGRTEVSLQLDATGSVFVVFTDGSNTDALAPTFAPPALTQAFEISGPWRIIFPPHLGAPSSIMLDKLISWTDDSDAGVKYFSGTAIYLKTFDLPAGFIKYGPMVLDLGDVKNVAEVSVNERKYPALWKPPFKIDVSDSLKNGENKIEIDVTNLWANRLIGDENSPDDCEWGEMRTIKNTKNDPNPAPVGRNLMKVPQWLIDGTPRPSKDRIAFTTFKYFTKDSPLLPSGLLGPVMIESR